MIIQRQVKTVGKYDVVVCGGGPAGWIAAVTAARAGRKTALIERFGFMGGTASGGIVVPLSGFYLKGRQVVGGIPFEFVKRMEAMGAAIFEMPKGHISFDPETYKLVCQEMLVEAGVEVYANALLTDCVREENRITAVVMENKNGAEAIEADCFIDATGDGDLAHLSGVTMLEKAPDEELQPMSLCFLLGGVDTSTPLLRDCIHHDGKTGASCNMTIHDKLAEACAAGEIEQFGGPWFNVTVTGDALAVNITRTAADGADNRSLRDGEFRLRRNMFAIVAFLKKTYPEFAHCHILSSAPLVGIRETRHIRGYYTVTGDDILSGRTFADSVAVCAHPIDIHSAKGGEQICRRLDRSAGIPYRTMISPDCANLLCAGRCISADRIAYATIRVQATAMALGQAAGVAANLFCGGLANVADVCADALIPALHALGGITE